MNKAIYNDDDNDYLYAMMNALSGTQACSKGEITEMPGIASIWHW